MVYVAGSENVLADALSRMHSNDVPGTVRARSEYTYHDVLDDDTAMVLTSQMPILAGIEAAAATRPRRARKIVEPAETGRAETLKEFATRMVGKFVLKGPRERTEGEGLDKKPKSTEDDSRACVAVGNSHAVLDHDLHMDQHDSLSSSPPGE